MAKQDLRDFLGIEKAKNGHEAEVLDEDKIDWTFKEADVKKDVHGLHPYPARMVPQGVEKLIKIFSSKAEEAIGHRNWAIYDPFCGSGTVLTEGKRLGFNVYGTDINPLAIIIAQVKATPIPKKRLENAWTILKRNYIRSWKKTGYKEIEDPQIPRLDFWFKPQVIQRLKVIKKSIWDLEKFNIEEDTINFFKVCFSITVRKVSNNRQGEFKLYRLAKKDLEKWNPNVFETFETRVLDSIKRMHQFFKIAQNSAVGKAVLYNSKTYTPPEPIGLVITSPPYGDHKTTVAYGQFSRYSAYWLGFHQENVSQIDNNGLGGRIKNYNVDKISLSKYGSEYLSETINAIIKGDQEATQEKREREIEKAKKEGRTPDLTVKSNPRINSVITFFDEYFMVIKNVYENLLSGGYACFVTGNRTVRRYRIPTHEITREFGIKVGFRHYKTLERSIPTKTMPWENAPSNVIGDKGQTMATEHIVILFKPKANE
ncbi:MAG: DNA methyltransferase [Candidatus Hermodarchaeota archaeon]